MVIDNTADNSTQNEVSDEVNGSELGEALFLCQSQVNRDDHDTDEKSVNRMRVQEKFMPHVSTIEHGLTNNGVGPGTNRYRGPQKLANGGISPRRPAGRSCTPSPDDGEHAPHGRPP